ncbi:DUF2381 family protein [Stigmatella sp. ncwal1]|uniref:DUF2381 family protein n=1 Tax=Stigmatella ashevillensis TaxID=2995309 RepID=A0ABT5DEL0_9BACT|nr:DUF2381 family protein [Stigmatella ashevillena]MDC0711553.1 DUF2381 family protein [Stigmatella ashevillena]
MKTYQARWMVQVALSSLLWAASAADAQAQLCQPNMSDSPMPRRVFLSTQPKDGAAELYVAGGVATLLRLPVAADPVGTRLLGWEGRFEPLLLGGRSVVLVPLQNLAPEDRFMLLVTLADGRELPFTVTSSSARVDGQVDIYIDPESPEAVRTVLEEKRQEVRSLKAENHRQREEGTSVDHALAALLARNEVAMTPFIEDDKWLLSEEGLDVEVTVFVSKRKKAVNRKAAVVLKVTNKDAVRPWVLQEARLTTWATREQRPFALRTTPSPVAPGESARIAVVTDFASFDSGTGTDKLVLEIFRDGGHRQVYVELVPKERR